MSDILLAVESYTGELERLLAENNAFRRESLCRELLRRISAAGTRTHDLRLRLLPPMAYYSHLEKRA